MSRFILFMLALGVLGWAAYYGMRGSSDVAMHDTPPAQLENVRKAADKIEADWQERADQTAKDLNNR